MFHTCLSLCMCVLFLLFFRDGDEWSIHVLYLLFGGGGGKVKFIILFYGEGCHFRS